MRVRTTAFIAIMVIALAGATARTAAAGTAGESWHWGIRRRPGR